MPQMKKNINNGDWFLKFSGLSDHNGKQNKTLLKASSLSLHFQTAAAGRSPELVILAGSYSAVLQPQPPAQHLFHSMRGPSN